MSCNHKTTQARIAAGRRRSGGFTFIEVMVVVVIIGMLAGAVTLKVGQYMDEAKISRAKSDITTIVKAIEATSLKGDGKHPSNAEGLSKLNVDIKRDPWGNEYQYNDSGPDGEPFEVYTLGADGEPGGDGVDADIYSWQIGKEED
ncbi:MAG: type II secretion system protein GspG [Phycisphaerae bacterium]